MMKKTYLVTGGTHGIGRACVDALARQGHHVVFVGRDAAAGRSVEHEIPGTTYVCADVKEIAQCKTAVDTAVEVGGGRLDGLVNNAGVTLRRPFHETTFEQWDDIFAINTRSAVVFTQFALEALKQARGSVVNVASVAGLVGAAGLAAYTASKAALIGLTQSLALEYGRDVRFNAICPGQIATRMMASTLADADKLQRLLTTIPTGRIGQADDVAATVVWLMSDAASFVNGVVLPIDGAETSGFGPSG